MKNNSQGFAALFTVVIIASAVLLLSRGAAFLGLGELELEVTYQQGQEAFALADGCMEEAFRRIRLDTSYSGTPTLTVPNGSCSITVVDPAPPSNARTVTVTGNSNDYYQSLETQITLTGSTLPTITVTSWREINS